MVLDSVSLSEIAHIRIPERYDIALKAEGLQVHHLAAPSAVIDAKVSPFKSRGPSCRRVLATCAEGRKLVIEFSSFSEQYEPEIDGVIRASEALIEGDTLVLKSARFRDQASELAEIVSERDAMDPRRLYESPFTDFDAQGVSGVFPQADVQRIVQLLGEVGRRAAA